MKKSLSDEKDSQEYSEVDLAFAKVNYFLAIAEVPKEVREAWASLMPFMNDEQLIRFSAYLEAQFIDQLLTPLDDSFKIEMKRLVGEYLPLVSKVGTV